MPSNLLLPASPRAPVVQATPVDPTGSNNVSALMMGLAIPLTPTLTGTVVVTCQTILTQSVAADGGIVRLRYGTGAAPANGASSSGVLTAGTAVNLSVIASPTPCALVALLTGLAIGTPIWIDLGVAVLTGGICTPTKICVVAFEQH